MNLAFTPDSSSPSLHPGAEHPQSGLPQAACGGSLLSQAPARKAPVERQDRQERSKFTQAAPPSVSFTSGSHLIKPSPPPPPSPPLTPRPTPHMPTSAPPPFSPARASTQTLVGEQVVRRRQVTSWRCPLPPILASSGPQTSPVAGVEIVLDECL